MNGIFAKYTENTLPSSLKKGYVIPTTGCTYGREGRAWGEQGGVVLGI